MGKGGGRGVDETYRGGLRTEEGEKKKRKEGKKGKGGREGG